PPILWLTHRGCRQSGTGFDFIPPRVGALARVRAVNEIRLHITGRAPDARWICGRTVFREQGGRGHRPHAVAVIGEERHAMLALLNWKPKDRLIPLLESQMRRHDAAIVSARSRLRRSLDRLASTHHWPKLVLREIPYPGPFDHPAPSDDAPSRC